MYLSWAKSISVCTPEEISQEAATIRNLERWFRPSGYRDRATFIRAAAIVCPLTHTHTETHSLFLILDCWIVFFRHESINGRGNGSRLLCCHTGLVSTQTFENLLLASGADIDFLLHNAFDMLPQDGKILILSKCLNMTQTVVKKVFPHVSLFTTGVELWSKGGSEGKDSWPSTYILTLQLL